MVYYTLPLLAGQTRCIVCFLKKAQCRCPSKHYVFFSSFRSIVPPAGWNPSSPRQPSPSTFLLSPLSPVGRGGGDFSLSRFHHSLRPYPSSRACKADFVPFLSSWSTCLVSLVGSFEWMMSFPLVFFSVASPGASSSAPTQVWGHR